MKKCESGRNKVEIFLLLYDHIIRNKSVRHEAEQLVFYTLSLTQRSTLANFAILGSLCIHVLL